MREKTLAGWCLGAALSLLAMDANAQIYGFTNEKGVLILSNVPTDSRMNLIARGSPEEAGKIWRYNGQYDRLILRAARESGVDHALVKAVIAVESAFNRFARSPKGAQGLMQLMPETGRRYGVVNP
jgi:soluble lytic murein transglycosylase-like protein